jgi:hypothetical protein
MVAGIKKRRLELLGHDIRMDQKTVDKKGQIGVTGRCRE